MAYFNRNTTENSIKSSIRSRVGDVAFAKKKKRIKKERQQLAQGNAVAIDYG